MMIYPCPNCGHPDSRFNKVSPDDPRQHLHYIDLEIASVEAYLDTLRGKKPLLKRQINHLVVPILRCPPDIYSEIFIRCIDDEWKPHCRPITPFTLGSICGAWRDLVWAMPWLWNKVRVDIDQSSASRCVLLEGWLARSSDYPLSIQLKGVLQVQSSFIAQTLDIVSRFSERWQHIDFHVGSACFDLLAGIQNRLPLLTSMVLRGHGTYPIIHIFSVAPQLREVTLIGLQLTQVNLPTTQLTMLTTPIYYESNNCLDILRCAQRLTTITLKLHPLRWNDMLTPVVIPQVKSLKLCMEQRTPRPFSHLIDIISVPSLHTIKFNIDFNSFPTMSFVSLINRSSCSLTRLVLSRLIISDINLLKCLRVVPLLKVLSLKYSSAGTRTFRMLNPNHASEPGHTDPLLPNLETFIYVSWKPEVHLNDDFIDMLCSRWNGNGVACLRFTTISVSDPHISKARTKDLLQHLISQGMDIRISSSMISATLSSVSS